VAAVTGAKQKRIAYPLSWSIVSGMAGGHGRRDYRSNHFHDCGNPHSPAHGEISYLRGLQRGMDKQNVKTQPSLERALRHKEILKA
jgi:hypothetical protein